MVGALKEQQGTLDDSRLALKQSVDIITAQKNLLQQSVQTSRNQLAVLDAQWKRELERPDIHAILVYPDNPAVGIRNDSKVKPIRDGKWQFFSNNIDRWSGNGYQMVQHVTETVDPIRPMGSLIPKFLSLRLDPSEPLEKGNRLYGYLYVGCPDCITSRMYWVLIKYKERGWFVEVPPNDPQYCLPSLQKLTPLTVEEHVDRFLARKDLIEIPARPPGW